MHDQIQPELLKKYTCIILCGGQSLRMRFDLPNLNKLLAPVNNTTLLHHVLDYYCSTGLFNKFILCLGGESDIIRDSFYGSPKYNKGKWNGAELLMIETGIKASATHRVYKALTYIDDEMFFLTYGDVLSNINFHQMLSLHTEKNSDITLALVKAKMPYGRVFLDKDDRINDFVEKPVLEHWINAGYFILKKNAISDKDIGLEYESEFLPAFLKRPGRTVYGYKHEDYWKGIDTYKDLVELRNEWDTVRRTKLFPTGEEQ